MKGLNDWLMRTVGEFAKLVVVLTGIGFWGALAWDFVSRWLEAYQL